MFLLQDFFAEGGQVHIRPATLDRGIKQLKGVIYLYRQTTEMLISDYIADSNATSQSTDASCGEVSMEIDAYHHPATGELEGTIRGVCVWVHTHTVGCRRFILCGKLCCSPVVTM